MMHYTTLRQQRHGNRIHDLLNYPAISLSHTKVPLSFTLKAPASQRTGHVCCSALPEAHTREAVMIAAW